MSAGSPRYSLIELALGQPQRLDHVAGEEAVLRADARVERQLGDAVRDQVEVGRLLHVLGEELEEAGVVDRVIVVVAGVHVERVLGDGARRDVEHVREPLADRRRTATRACTRCPGRSRSSSARRPVMLMPAVTAAAACSPSGSKKSSRRPFTFGLPVGDRRRPALAHLRRRRDRVGAGGFARRGLHRDDGARCRRAPRRMPGERRRRGSGAPALPVQSFMRTGAPAAGRHAVGRTGRPRARRWRRSGSARSPRGRPASIRS